MYCLLLPIGIAKMKLEWAPTAWEKEVAPICPSMFEFAEPYTAIPLVFSLKAPCGGCSLIHPPPPAYLPAVLLFPRVPLSFPLPLLHLSQPSAINPAIYYCQACPWNRSANWTAGFYIKAAINEEIFFSGGRGGLLNLLPLSFSILSGRRD